MEYVGHTLRLKTQLLRAPSDQWIRDKPASVEADPLVGQERALNAIKRSQSVAGHFAHLYAIIPAGMEPRPLFEHIAERQTLPTHDLHDWVYVVNPHDGTQPLCLHLPAGSAKAAIERLWALLDTETGEREEILQSIKEQFKWPPLNRYLDQVKEKTFDDLPGSELATIIVSQAGSDAWHYCARATESELFGDIRLQTVAGTVSSELHLIKPGALLKANGGTLVIDAEQLLRQTENWHRLKHVLKTGEFTWNQPGNEQVATFYSPQPVPVKVKVILAGNRGLLSQLRNLDADFENLFPYLADFTNLYTCQTKPVAPYFNYLAYIQQRAQHRDLSEDAYRELLTISASFTEHQKELSLDSLRLVQLLQEADAIAHEDKCATIKASHLRSAVQEQQYREHYMAELSQQSILEHQVKIDTDGVLIGQINGLTVVFMGGSEFGEPSRITATVHYGDGDIIDIERKSELSGNIHTKGVMILMAYLANLFAERDPMPLSATLVFEQSYHEVDGDSASLAELCCLVSALSETPIVQSLAVTGAIDQFGNVQAIGGVNTKIEGFFNLCKQRGLTGEHGVIVPQANLMNLHLSEEICEAVERGLFSVFAVSHVREAFELLMRTPCGTASDRDTDTLLGRVYKRIRDAQQHDETRTWWRRLLRR